jgi:hypothetical protein
MQSSKSHKVRNILPFILLIEEVVNTSVKRETASSSLGQHDHHGSDDESES